MRETQLFDIFSPPNSRILLLGGFTAKRDNSDDNYDWYYVTKRNQFWPILETIYELDLSSKTKKTELFEELGIAIADIIYSCERKQNNSSDSNLAHFEYNFKGIRRILDSNPIEKVLFTSRFVEKQFRKNFRHVIEENSHIQFMTLPSPSPRYAAISKEEKTRVYREALPSLKR